MNNIVQNLEEQILKNYNGLRIDYFAKTNGHDAYWRYECNKKVRLTPDVHVGSLLCYSVTGKTREEACNQLYNAIKEDKECEERMLAKYNKFKENLEYDANSSR